MRKLTILLGVAVLAASSTGCCGRCRNWFHKGSPCGTVMSPAMLSAPVAMGAPLAGPVMQPNMCCEQTPVMCVPCDPCDPCATGGMGVTTGYFGNYMGGSDCGCEGGASAGAVIQSVPTTGIMPQPTP